MSRRETSGRAGSSDSCSHSTPDTFPAGSCQMSMSLEHGRQRRVFPQFCWQPGIFAELRGCCGYPQVGWDSPRSNGEAAARGCLGMGFWVGPAGSASPSPPFLGGAECHPALFPLRMLLLNSQPGDAAAISCQRDGLHLLALTQVRGENSGQFPPSQHAI